MGVLSAALAGVFSATPAQACVISEYSGPQTAVPSAQAQNVFDKAMEAEKISGKRAVELYRKSVHLKNGYAAKRLYQIYYDSQLGIQRDYGKALQFGDIAERLGVKVWVGKHCFDR